MYPTVVESGLRLEQDERGWLYLVRRDGSPLDVKHLDTPGIVFSSIYRPDEATVAAWGEVVKALTEEPVPVTCDEVTFGRVDPGSVVAKDGRVTANVVVEGGYVTGMFVCNSEGDPLPVVPPGQDDDGCDAPTVVGG